MLRWLALLLSTLEEPTQLMGTVNPYFSFRIIGLELCGSGCSFSLVGVVCLARLTNPSRSISSNPLFFAKLRTDVTNVERETRMARGALRWIFTPSSSLASLMPTGAV